MSITPGFNNVTPLKAVKSELDTKIHNNQKITRKEFFKFLVSYSKPSSLTGSIVGTSRNPSDIKDLANKSEDNRNIQLSDNDQRIIVDAIISGRLQDPPIELLEILKKNIGLFTIPSSNTQLVSSYRDSFDIRHDHRQLRHTESYNNKQKLKQVFLEKIVKNSVASKTINTSSFHLNGIPLKDDIRGFNQLLLGKEEERLELNNFQTNNNYCFFYLKMYSFTKSKVEHVVPFNNLMNNYYALDNTTGDADTFTNIVLDKLKYSDSEIIVPFQTSGGDLFEGIPKPGPQILLKFRIKDEKICLDIFDPQKEYKQELVIPFERDNNGKIVGEAKNTINKIFEQYNEDKSEVNRHFKGLADEYGGKQIKYKEKPIKNQEFTSLASFLRVVDADLDLDSYVKFKKDLSNWVRVVGSR